MGPSLDVDKAFAFYQRFILGQVQDKEAIYREYGFTVQGSVVPRDWEVFAAILLRDKKKPGDGADLEKHEVKSAIHGSSFEYQYHKINGLLKLADDKGVNHVFISYSTDYKNVEVWWLPGEKLAVFFDEWEPKLIENYTPGRGGRQRFRRSIPFHFPRKDKNGGILILQIKNGAVIKSLP